MTEFDEKDPLLNHEDDDDEDSDEEVNDPFETGGGSSEPSESTPMTTMSKIMEKKEQDQKMQNHLSLKLKVDKRGKNHNPSQKMHEMNSVYFTQMQKMINFKLRISKIG